MAGRQIALSRTAINLCRTSPTSSDDSKPSLTLPGDRRPLDDSPANPNEIRGRLRYQRPRLLTAGSATELIRGAPATGDEKVSYWSLLFFPIMALLILLWAVVCLFQNIVQSETKEHASKIP